MRNFLTRAGSRTALALMAAALIGLASSQTRADTTAAKSSPWYSVGPNVASVEDGQGYNPGDLHADAGFDYVSAGFFRGIRQPENAPVLEGYGDIYLDVVNTGSMHFGGYVGGRTSAGEASGGPFSNYLEELFAGVRFRMSPFSLDLGYIEHHSPVGAFGPVHEVGARLDFNDASLMQGFGMPFSLNPHVGLFREVTDTNLFASPISEPAHQNSYLEVGIVPTVQVPLGDTPLAVGVPLTAGMSWDNYYSLTPTSSSNFFGYLSAGAMASVPLPFPSSWGKWDVRGGLNWIYDTANGPVQIDHGHREFFQFGGAIAVSY